MKFLKVNMNHEDMISDFFSKYPDVDFLTYREIVDLYFDEYYWPSNSLEKNLNSLYGWECTSIVFPQGNHKKESLFFDKWCEANGVVACFEDRYERLLQQIVFCDPDILYIHGIAYFPESFFKKLRYVKPQIKILGWNCAQNSLASLYGHWYIDALYTCSADMELELKQQGFAEAIRINHMFDPDILQKPESKDVTKEYDLIFFGQLDKGYHRERIELLEALVESKINIAIFANTDNPKLKPHCKPPVFGRELYEVISKSKIVLNMHADSVGVAAALRLFEVTGMGAMLLTDHKPNLSDIFIENQEMVSFKSYAEAITLVEYYLENDSKREKIAEAGQRKTLQNYTYKNIAEEVYRFSQKEVSSTERLKNISRLKYLEDRAKIDIRKNINQIIKQAKTISNIYKKVAIYGNGNITKLIKDEIPNLVAIFDRASSVENGIFSIEEIASTQFDAILITSLGYEPEISKKLIDELGVDAKKVLFVDI